MMKAADLGDAADLGIRRGVALGDSSLRRISQLRMDSICVVVLDVVVCQNSTDEFQEQIQLFERSFQMPISGDFGTPRPG
jgi:hypothetical protein